MSLQAKLQAESIAYQKVQSEHSQLVEARQKLDAQLSENELVKKEFDQLTSDNVVYKQIGPALVLQDQSEAKTNVETRLEFIRGEIRRVEVQLKDTELRAEMKKQELVDIQTALQQQHMQQKPMASTPPGITS